MTIVIALFIICIFTIFVLSALASDDGPDSTDPFDEDWEAPELEPPELELIVKERARRANEIGLENQLNNQPNGRQNSLPSNEGLWGDGT